MEYSVFSNPFEIPQKRCYFNSYFDEAIVYPSSVDAFANRITELFSGISLEYCEFVAEKIALNENWRDSISLYPAIEASLLGLRDYLGFVFPHPGDVVDYLIQNPGLYDVVMHACSMTAEEFGSTSQIALDVFHDPESNDRYLTLYVRQERYEDDIITRMDRICNRYEPALMDLSGWLLLTTDYKPPST
ncbi:MAG: hypothetical protein GX837_09490 [Methanomicrobiales archaeon]|nr:hypothetical protein [Methanomicrobiales archaeon]